MLDERRKAYLKAIGIELWSERDPQSPMLGGLAAAASSVAEDSPVAPAGGVEQPDVIHPVRPQAPVAAQVPDQQSVREASAGSLAGEQPPAFEQIPAEAYLGLPEHDQPDDEEFEAPAAPSVASLDWSALAERVAGCHDCSLCESRSNTVFGVGDRQASLLVVGEAPGADEDRQGEPFVGRAGLLLNAMLEAIGLAREQVYIANILKCRPPNNRDPQPAEVAACQPYLNRQIALLKPRLILSVGGVSAKNLLQTDTPVGRLRGQVHRYAATDTPLMVTYHPAYLLRKPAEKAKAWADLQQLHRYLHQESGA